MEMNSLGIKRLIILSLEIVKSWFAQVDADGWIAREQILGDEARSKVPAEFQIQYPHYANPPTLFIVLNDYLTKLEVHQKEKEQMERCKLHLLPYFSRRDN